MTDTDEDLRQFGRPWKYIHPTRIEPRAWLYGGHYIRRFVSATVAPGGLGKSALTLAEAICLATGRGFLGVLPDKRVKVFYRNGEDPIDEIERRIAAICLQFNIDRKDLEGWLFISSGREEDFRIGTTTRDGVSIDKDLIDDFVEFVFSQDIGVVICDPFVSCHHVPENDNGAIDDIVKAWGRIADRANCSVELVHHVRKGQGGATEIDDARGAKALIDAVRSGRVLNAMSDEQARDAGVDNPGPYFNTTNGKANLQPRSDKRTWFRFVSVGLGNPMYGRSEDSVGVVTPWDWPAPQKMCDGEIASIQSAIAALGDDTQSTRKDPQSTLWVGHIVGPMVGLNPDSPADKPKLKRLIGTLLADGHLTTTQRADQKSKIVPFVSVSTTTNIAVEKGGEGGK